MTINLLPLYIDPGTGSMLFSLFIGLATTVVFAGRALFIKIKVIICRGKQSELDKSHLGIVIFSDSKRYWNLFKPIADEFERRKNVLIYYTQSSDDPALSENYKYVKTEYIGNGNKGFAKMNLLNADICLSTTPGLDVLQWKRSKTVNYYVHIPHSLDEMMAYRMFGLDFYDSVLLTGDFQGKYIRRLEEMRGIPQKELVTVGYPPMDEQKKRLDSMPSKQSDKITILVAPSWGKEAILSKFGSEFLSAIKETGFNIIVRPHPQTKTSEKEMLESLMKEFPESESFKWNFDNDNFSCMNEASILITDFSGIIFDFALLFDKPLIYADTKFDSGIYDAAWFENEKLWRFSVLEKIGIPLKKDQFADMKSVIERALKDTTLQQGRDEARDEAWMHRGESARLIADYLINKQKELTQSDGDSK